MIAIISALLPIFSLILIGYYLNKLKFPSEDFWPMADKLTYFILMPSLLIYKLGNATESTGDNFTFISLGLLCLLLVFIVMLILNKIFKFDNASFTSVVQGGIRFNTYVFLALLDSLYGDEGLVLGVLFITFAIPLINLICIFTFALYTSSTKITYKSFYKSIVSNPLIIACFTGGMINLSGFSIPDVINSTLDILSGAALPLGLISVGVSLVLNDIKNSKNELYVANIIKLIFTPLLFYIVATLFSLPAVMVTVLVLFASMPTAPSAFVLARQLGGNLNLMASTISTQTLLSIFTITIILNFIVN